MRADKDTKRRPASHQDKPKRRSGKQEHAAVASHRQSPGRSPAQSGSAKPAPGAKGGKVRDATDEILARHRDTYAGLAKR